MPHPEEISARLVRPERWVGGFISVLVCSGNADQPITNVESAINFDTNDVGPIGQISRSGNDINIGIAAYYNFILQPQITQNVANNISTIWIRKNGVDVPNSATRFSSTGTNDTTVLVLAVSARLVAGDSIRFMAKTSAVAGATLDFTAAGGGVPANPSVILDIVGFGPIA